MSQRKSTSCGNGDSPPAQKMRMNSVMSAPPTSIPIDSTVDVTAAAVIEEPVTFSVAEESAQSAEMTAIFIEQHDVLNESVESLILTAVSPVSSPPKERTYKTQMRSPVKRSGFRKRASTPIPSLGIVGRLPFENEDAPEKSKK